MSSYKRIMRYANYSDPYARKEDGTIDYGAAICYRGDLADNGKGRAGGCYDTKVTSYRHGFWNLSAEIVNGPTSIASDGTAGRSGNAPFKWRSVDDAVPHFGLPEKYDFDFITTAPEDLSCARCENVAAVVV